jgi:hypothetical protein
MFPLLVGPTTVERSVNRALGRIFGAADERQRERDAEGHGP